MVQATLSHLVTQQMVSNQALIIIGNNTLWKDNIACLLLILFASKKKIKEFWTLNIINSVPLSLVWNPWAWWVLEFKHLKVIRCIYHTLRNTQIQAGTIQEASIYIVLQQNVWIITPSWVKVVWVSCVCLRQILLSEEITSNRLVLPSDSPPNAWFSQFWNFTILDKG